MPTILKLAPGSKERGYSLYRNLIHWYSDDSYGVEYLIYSPRDKDKPCPNYSKRSLLAGWVACLGQAELWERESHRPAMTADELEERQADRRQIDLWRAQAALFDAAGVKLTCQA